MNESARSAAGITPAASLTAEAASGAGGATFATVEADSIRMNKPLVCPQCERASLVRRHCKTLCECCGYVESCEDNFVPLEENPRIDR